MPDNTSTGMLEEFVARLVPEGDALWPRVQHCVDSVPSALLKGALSKIKIHTWLAWQEEPGKPMGAAIGRTYLDAHSPHALRFVEWIRRMIAQKPTFPAQPNVLA